MMVMRVMVIHVNLPGNLAQWLMFVTSMHLAFIAIVTKRTSANAILVMKVMVISAGYLVSDLLDYVHPVKANFTF